MWSFGGGISYLPLMRWNGSFRWELGGEVLVMKADRSRLWVKCSRPLLFLPRFNRFSFFFFTKCFFHLLYGLGQIPETLNRYLKKKQTNKHNNFPPLNYFHGESITNIFASSFQKFCLFYGMNFIRALQGNKSRELLITWEPVHIHILLFCFILFCSLFV